MSYNDVSIGAKRWPRITQTKTSGDAIQIALDLGWTKIDGSGHCYCTLRCPHGAGGCQIRVACTPKNRTGHAKRKADEIRSCPHGFGGQPQPEGDEE